jgi:hypothetical protein
MIKFPLFQKNVIVGLILSDASLPPSKLAKNVPLTFVQSIDKFEYL